MWTLSQIIGMGMLSVLSIVDIQFRKVPVEILAAANLAVLVYQIMFQGKTCGWYWEAWR